MITRFQPAYRFSLRASRSLSSAGIGNYGSDPGPERCETADKAFARTPVRYAGRLAAARNEQPERVDEDVTLAALHALMRGQTAAAAAARRRLLGRQPGRGAQA